MKEIKTVTILGANGSMGSGSAAILAGFGGMKVYMLARTLEKAKEGITKAVKSIRSDVIIEQMIPGTYESDLEVAIENSDWVFELLAEDYAVKESMLQKINKYKKPGTVVSTVSSGLSISRLAANLDEDGQKNYFGTHFFNPPYKLVLCELVAHPGSDSVLFKEFGGFLETKLRRVVVYTEDKPAFAGNRVGFQLMNEVAQYAKQYADKGGIALMDEILSGYTGRAMGPLATVNFVGLDVHKAIVDNLYETTNDFAHETFKMPEYFEELINAGSLGLKSKVGLYKIEKNADGSKTKFVYNIETREYDICPKFNILFIQEAKAKIGDGDYQGALDIIKNAEGFEAELCRYFLAKYISYSLSLVGEVVETKEMIDMAMGFGFNWVPASALVDLLGGVAAAKEFLKAATVEIPDLLEEAPLDQKFYQINDILDARSLFRSK
ncbi:MAG: 3-hydroxyacyl-CoA dehydrogenase family protein [bacterium]|nr:3-hydroxyacyl-CoA dehydrogenase family protein [bacterium]